MKIGWTAFYYFSKIFIAILKYLFWSLKYVISRFWRNLLFKLFRIFLIAHHFYEIRCIFSRKILNKHSKIKSIYYESFFLQNVTLTYHNFQYLYNTMIFQSYSLHIWDHIYLPPHIKDIHNLVNQTNVWFHMKANKKLPFDFKCTKMFKCTKNQDISIL